jgi:hypothetical protein
MTEIAAALSHLRIARSHIDQGLEHLAAADRDENTDEPGFTLTCDDCGHEFDPHEATHSIVGLVPPKRNVSIVGRETVLEHNQAYFQRRVRH